MSLYVNSVIKCNNNQHQFWLNPLSANPTKWSNTLKPIADELFECVWPF